MMPETCATAFPRPYRLLPGEPLFSWEDYGKTVESKSDIVEFYRNFAKTFSESVFTYFSLYCYQD
ncbi:MAG: hypothetical protein IPM53_21350 [Anaerolineaceae bacterium]|nr:hypothetical protein [Anaerolineaceae bacterium]